MRTPALGAALLFALSVLPAPAGDKSAKPKAADTKKHTHPEPRTNSKQADVIALSRVLRQDRNLVHAEAWLFSHAVVEPMLHATATLAR